jgi:hypothetical protein
MGVQGASQGAQGYQGAANIGPQGNQGAQGAIGAAGPGSGLTYQSAVVTTSITGDVVTASVAVSLPSGSSCTIRAIGLGHVDIGGTGTTAGDTATRESLASFKCISGTVTQVGSTATILSVNDASMAVSQLQFTLVPSNIVVQFLFNADGNTFSAATATIFTETLFVT